MTNNEFLDKNVNNKTKQKSKNPCRSRELNPGSLAPKADALPLHHQVNWELLLKSSFLTVLTQWVKMQIKNPNLRAIHF